MKTKPTTIDRKVPQSVSLRLSIIKKAREKGLNLGPLVEEAIELACGEDPEEIELSRLQKEIAEMQAELAPKMARAKYLKESLQTKRRLQIDLSIERDCHAWYLRSLVQSGVFKVGRMDSIDPAPMIMDDIKSGIIRDCEVDISEGKARLTDKASAQTRKRLRQFLRDRGNNLSAIPAREWVSPDLETLRSTYGLSLDIEEFQDEFLRNQSIGDLPLDFFARFRPVIIQDRIKSEVKARMEPEYRNFALEAGGVT
ncbi:hypothetical protein DMB44_04360 [Thermoplasma sp. Kam2015]|uniref:hypothetical protein n=1 Tax=Thermoplasma sp. Kam2015 TaxID=2094122 RepID=UPI000D833EBD|nr:hypothetical protein [Thermoplasma sp. Kam2015]PYB68283.1 hypothetical protein DMB44_04360 [Thermoplasma sp. Kam2015]